MLNIFAGKATIPNYRVVAPANGEIQQITVSEEVRRVLRVFLTAVLTTAPRPLASVLTSLLQYCATSISPRSDMIPSLPFRTSCTRTYVVREPLSPWEPTT